MVLQHIERTEEEEKKKRRAVTGAHQFLTQVKSHSCLSLLKVQCKQVKRDSLITRLWLKTPIDIKGERGRPFSLALNT